MSVHAFTLQAPQEDVSERALFDAFLLVNDFKDAIYAATTPARALQIQERIAAVIADFQKAELQALRRADALCGK